MIDYTVNELVTDVKTTASVPAAQPRFSVDGIIKIMTRILQSKIVPMMMTVREEYFVDYEDYQIVQGNNLGYPIPKAAVGMKVRDVCLVNQQANLLNMTTLPRLSLEEISATQYGQYVPFGIYIQNNNVILWPPNQSAPTNTLRMYFIRRTNVLTSSANCGQVEGIAGNVLTLTQVPTTWVVGDLINTIDAEPGFNTTARDREITDITGLDVTLDDVEDIAETNWVALNGYSPIAQIPVEAQQLLVQATALEILKSMGNDKGYQKLEVEYKQLVEYVMDVITPRVDSSPKKALAVNGIAGFCGFGWRS